MSANSECLFNPSVEIDINTLPKILKEYAVSLEQLYKEDDWVTYNYKCDELEVKAKNCLVHDLITARQLSLIRKRYCGYNKDSNDYTEEEKRSMWNFAVGIQAVDDLEVSVWFKNLVEEEIKGNITFDELDDLLNERHKVIEENKNERKEKV